MKFSARRFSVGVCAAWMIFAAPTDALAASPKNVAERFAGEIGAFEAADRLNPPVKCPIVFVGSSTVRRWASLSADFAPMAVLNRGFGGSQISDVDNYFDQVVTPYKPRAIVFYAGDNDIAAHKSPLQVFNDFKRFMALKDYRLGTKTPVYFISIKPSLLRVDELKQQAQANALVRRWARFRADLRYIDVVPAMMAHGAPAPLFVADGLHMNAQGYAIWAKIVRAALADLGPARCA